MQRIVSRNLWPEVRTLYKKSKSCKAVIAYVTDDEFMKLGKSDALIVDASDVAIAAGQTNASVLQAAHRRGATIYCLDRLHAKFMVLDQGAIVGSANLSVSSSNDLVEVAVVTDSPAIMGALHTLFDQLASQSALLDEATLSRLCSIPVKRTNKRLWRSRKVEIPSTDNQTWLVSVKELDGARFQDEAELVADGLALAKEQFSMKTGQGSWIRCVSNDKFRKQAKAGDNVIQIWRPLGSKLPTAVYKRAWIRRRQEESNCTRLFLEEPRNAENESMSWNHFKRMWAGSLPGRVGPSSCRLLSPTVAESVYSVWKNKR